MQGDALEVWKPVLGYEGLYEVSDRGRVRSLDRLLTTGAVREGRVLKCKISHKGYAIAGLSRRGRMKHARVHRLVAEAFHGPSDLPHVRHLDSDKLNNTPSNLAWGTAAENIHDNVVRGVIPGMSNTHCKYGHEYTEASTYWHPGTKKRRCRICQKERLSQRAKCDHCGTQVLVRCLDKHIARKHPTIGEEYE